MNVCDFISNNAIGRADMPAIVEGARVITYRDLDLALRRAAATLRRHGVGVGSRVGFVLKDNAEHMILFLAVARLGAVAMTLDWRAPTEAQAEMAALFDLAFVLADPAVPHCGHDAAIAIDENWRREVADAAPVTDSPAGGDAPMMIGTTSGTSGRAKGLLITHSQEMARATAAFLGHRWQLGERYFATSFFTYIIGREYPLFQLMAGNTVIFYPPFCGAGEYLEMGTRLGASAGFVVPSVLRRLLAEGSGTTPLLEGLRVLTVAGEPMSAVEKRAAAARLAPSLIEVYGSTGVGVATAHVIDPGDEDLPATAVGRSMPTLETAVVDDEGEAVAPGAVGRLRFRGPACSSAFYRSDLTGLDGETFADGWYYPGDFASCGDSGVISLAGRNADFIIRGGANIAAGEIEAVLQSHPAVDQAAIVGWPSRSFGQEIAAFAVLAAPVDTAALIRHCRDRLPAYKVPRNIFIVDRMPHGPTGKLHKRSLAERLVPLP